MSLLVTVIVVVLLALLVLAIINYLPVDPPAKQIANVVILVAAVFVLLLALTGHGPVITIR